MIYIKKYKYYLCKKTKISFLYQEKNTLKQNLMFIHGFGFGYIPYLSKLIELEKKFNLVIIILPNISSYNYYDEFYSLYFPTSIDLQNSVFDFLKNNNYEKINILAHSFGTYITQILRNDKRSIIFEKVIMIDPIIFWIGCFKMSTWIENNAYIKPYYENIFNNIATMIVVNCLYLKYVCNRVMFGPDFWIYDSSELDNKNIMLVLEKGDAIIPAELLYNKIKNNNFKFYYIDDDNTQHGSVIFDPRYSDKFDEIMTYYNT
jgi:hypothetical protein